MSISLGALQRDGRWLKITCWRCGWSITIQPDELFRYVGRQYKWQETVWHFGNRCYCMRCNARSPKTEVEFKPQDRPNWVKMAFPLPGDD